MSRPWMPLYVADYLRDTRHLTAAEHGAYLLLIMQYWTFGSLPNDDARLARIASMTEAEWLEAKPVIAEFFGPNWRHERIDEELGEAERLSDAGRAGGIASGARRKRIPKTQRSANDPGNDLPTIGERSGNGNTNDPATIPQPLQSQSQEDRIGDARAGGQSAFTEGSKRLANTFWKALGFDDPLQIPPEFSGVDWRAVAWEKAGWTPDLIEAEARKLARDGPLKPLNYFEKVFATSFAKRQTPLPIVEVRAAEKRTVTGHGRPQSTGGNIIQAADRLIEKIRSFDAGPGEDHGLRDGTGAPAARLLSQGGCE